MTPNMICHILHLLTAAAEGGYSVGVTELLEFFSARSVKGGTVTSPSIPMMTDRLHKVAQEGHLTFMCKGVWYWISIPDRCGIYGFKRYATQAILDTEWDQANIFWSYIGHGTYDSKITKQTDVRHPAMRYVLRVLGNTLLCRSDPSKMRKSDLMLLYLGLHHMFPEELWAYTKPNRDLNLGAVFANHITTLKIKAFSSKQFESVGCLLTPIFSHIGIVMFNASLNTSRIVMNHAYLRHVTWIKNDNIWIFTDSDGHVWNIKLPKQSLTEIRDDYTCIFLHPDQSLLSPPTSHKFCRGSSSSATPAAIKNEEVEEFSGGPIPNTEIPEPPAGYADDGPVFRKYMVNTMRKMWQILEAGVTCTRTTQSRRRCRSPTPEQYTPPCDDAFATDEDA
ncbi:hypothetical protein V5N11_013518 [Cardamine amara subsp. amara]|uniref:Arabidopsis retrotransposon Orf1 C-terminal domain-containing protein n=1 Tax=Cardamine amara subsp. amara TaxID=228776 RepID=A0ABD1BJ22_CARAN